MTFLQTFASLSRTRLPECILFWSLSFFWFVYVVFGIFTANVVFVMALPVTLFSRIKYRHICEWCANTSWPFFVYCFEILGKNKYFLYGDEIPKSEKSLVNILVINWCSNHLFGRCLLIIDHMLTG
jgi:hypothetical protein